MRLSLIAMVLCLCAAWPGHGLAWGMAGSASPAGMTPGAPQSSAEGEVRFIGTPDKVSYSFINEWNTKPNYYLHFSVANFAEGMAVRVQLEDAANPNGIEFRFNSNTDPALTLDNGGFWVPDEQLTQWDGSVSFNVVIAGSKECTAKYTVSVYETKSLGAKVMVATTHTARYLQGEQSPAMGNMERISGELDEDIPFSFSVTKAGFLQGQPAQIKISLSGSYVGLTLSGQNLRENADQGNMYILDIPSFSPAQFTLKARSAEACSGTIQLNICDADGCNVSYGTSVSFSIPANFSEDDINALKAIATANPLNSDLQNFIKNKEYLKDRTQSGYNVGVTWNTESTSRVRSFFIEDGRTQTVTSMEGLSGLTELEKLDLSNTRLKSLDLSALTKLRNVNLNGNDSLTWSTVKFPDPLPQNFNAYGYTRIMAGTPVDDNNAYAAKGTEIDLSAYATVGGKKSKYQWYRIEQDPYKSTEVTMKAVSDKEGAFIFDGKPGEYYKCEICLLYTSPSPRDTR